MTKITQSIVVLSAFALFYTTTIQAQAPAQNPWGFRIDGGGVHQSETDLKDSDGGFSVDRWFVGAGVDYSWDFRNSIGLSVGGGRSTYDFDRDTVIGDGEPWNKIENTRAALSARFGFGETGSAIIIPTVRFNGENGASSSDSRSYGLFAAVAWRIRKGLTIGPGVGVFSRLEDGTRVFPILVIDWDINDRWNLATGRGLAASQGPGLTLSYELNTNWSFGLSGRYENLEFRLDDHGVAPGGVGRDESLPLVLSAIFEPNPMIRLSVVAGVEFMGKLKLKNALDELVEESKYDPAPIIGATLALRF